MIYISKDPEVETMELLENLLSAGIRVVVPIIERETGSLRLSVVRFPEVFVQSTFGVPEPIGSEIPIYAGEIEAVVVPMLAFDRSGSRLGYGAGYYDRFFSENPCSRIIGLAYSSQEAADIPGEGFDVGMDVIITESEVFRID